MSAQYTLRCNQVNTSRCLTATSTGHTLANMSLSIRIKAAREHAGLTQIELSKMVDLPQQTISKLENGLQEETAGIVKIAVACKVDPVWLDSGEGEMIDGLYVEDEQIKRGVIILEQLQAEYRLDDALNLLYSISQFPTKKTSAEKK